MSRDPYTKHSSARTTRGTIPENPIDDETLFDALKDNLSPQAVATIIAYLQPARTNNPDVDRQVAWFVDGLVDLVGGDEAFNRLCEELEL